MALTGITIGGAAAGAKVGVPDVLDLPQAQAEAKVREAGLVPRIETVETEGTEGTVFGQDPPPRSVRPRGTTVTLAVIKAPVIPPNLGKDLAELKAAVTALGTKVDAVVPAVQGVGTKVDGVGTKVDGVGATATAIKAAVDALGTAVANVETDKAAEARKKAIIDRIDKIGHPPQPVQP